MPHPNPKSVRTGGDVGDVVGVGRVDAVLDQPQALAQRRPGCRPHEARTVSTHHSSWPEHFLMDKRRYMSSWRCLLTAACGPEDVDGLGPPEQAQCLHVVEREHVLVPVGLHDLAPGDTMRKQGIFRLGM